MELTTDDLRDIDSAASKIAMQGDSIPGKPGENDRPLNGFETTFKQQRLLNIVRFILIFKKHVSASNVQLVSGFKAPGLFCKHLNRGV